MFLLKLFESINFFVINLARENFVSFWRFLALFSLAPDVIRGVILDDKH